MLLKRFISFIKRLFSSKKVEHFDVYKTKNIYEQLEQLDVPIECLDEQQTLFDSLYEGDLVFAHMPLNDEELQKVPEGHRSRPYYIVCKLDNGFIAFGCSSTNSYSIDDVKSYKLLDYKYNLDKTTYVKLDKPVYLPKTKIIKCLSTISDYDSSQIYRRMYIHNEKDYVSYFKEEPDNCMPMPGDIICRDNRFLIISEEKDYYNTLMVLSRNNKTSSCAPISTYNHRYKVLLTNEFKIKKKKNRYENIIHIIDDEQLSYVKLAFEKKNETHITMQNGSLFTIDEQKYYCINFNKFNISAYKVFDYLKENSLDQVNIIVNNESLYVDRSKQFTITNFEKIKDITPLPVEYSRQVKSIITKKKVKKKSPKYFASYPIGTIFKNVDENEEYVYLYSNRSYDYFVKVSEYLNSDVYPEYPLHELAKHSMVRQGEVADDEIKQILMDQIEFGNEENNLLSKKLTILNLN